MLFLKIQKFILIESLAYNSLEIYSLEYSSKRRHRPLKSATQYVSIWSFQKLRCYFPNSLNLDVLYELLHQGWTLIRRNNRRSNDLSGMTALL